MTEERLCIPCVFEKIYAETKAGVTTYYLQEPGANPISLELFITQNGLKNVDANGNPLKAKDDTLTYVTDGETTEPVSAPETQEPVIDLTPDEEVVEDVVEENVGETEEVPEE